MAFSMTAGSAHYIDAGSGGARNSILTNSSGKMTLFAIVTPGTLGANHHIITKDKTIATDRTFDWVLNSDGSQRFIASRSVADSDFSSASLPLTAGVNYFIAVTFDDAASPKVNFYVSQMSDMTAMAATSLTTGAAGSGTYTADATAKLLFGSLDRSNTLSFGGVMHRAGVYSDTKTVAELGVIKHSLIGSVTTTNAVVLWEGHSSTVTDVSSNAFTLTVTGATAVASQLGSTLITPSHAQWYFSPLAWKVDGAAALSARNQRSDATYGLTARCGSFFRFPVVIGSGTDDAGNVWGHFDVTGLNSGSIPAANAPLLRVWIRKSIYGDERAATVALAPNANATNIRVPLATGLAAGTYMIDVIHDAVNLQTPGDRFVTPANAVKVTSIEADNGATIGTVTYSTNFDWFIGDSAAEGADAFGSDISVRANNSAWATDAFQIAWGLGHEPAITANGGIGINKGMGNNTVSTTFPSMWNTDSTKRWVDYYYQGAAMDFTNVPQHVFITLGINDGASGFTAADLTALIDHIRTLVGTSARIWVKNYPIKSTLADASHTLFASAVAGVATPGKVYHLSGITQLYAAAASLTSWWSYDNGTSSQHPNAYAHARTATQTVLAVEAVVAGVAAAVPGADGYIVIRRP